MKFEAILVLLAHQMLTAGFQSDKAFCCRYASMNENCHDSCLQIFTTKDENYLKKLQMHFPTNCPPKSPDLVEFWNCLNPTFNDSGGEWIGRLCCELAISDQCRNVCMQSNNKDNLSTSCNPEYEKDFYRCIFKQQNRKKCCGSPFNVSSSCRHQCELSFRSETGPSAREITRMATSCGEEMAYCMTNFTEMLRAGSIENVHCCKQATDESCRESCRQIFRTEIKDATIINRLIDACGDVMPHEPMWKCFMQNNEPTPRTGPFVARLQCCSRAMSYNCKHLCAQLYRDPWSEPDVWNQFERLCSQRADEFKLQQCLDEVSKPCKMGCSGMSFCSAFNDRTTALFRRCTDEADYLARHHYESWLKGSIDLPLVKIPVQNIAECEPVKWKAVACTLQIKPCSSKTGASIICKSDCLSLLNKCADKKRFPKDMEIDQLCETFSPSHMQSNCISLLTYTESSQSIKADETGVTQPCHPNPCGENQVCLINHESCGSSEENCQNYRCLQGCKLGQDSNMFVTSGAVVQVAHPSRGEDCSKWCSCSNSGALFACRDLPCSFNATVYNAETQQYRQSCNCTSNFQPVCSTNGRTYSNRCFSSCFNTSTEHIVNGSCMDINPCRPSPCKSKERCVHTPRTCMLNTNYCPQYECIPRYRQCSRLLKNAALAKERNTFKHRRGSHFSIQNTLSSSIFFSHIAYLSNIKTVCDTNNEEHPDICSLTRYKRKTLSYIGKCKKLKCPNEDPQRVCGQDMVTYHHSCQAETNLVLVDYFGPCSNLLEENFDNRCDDVTCPLLSIQGCEAVTPPGSCCSVCGGMMRVRIDRSRLKAIEKSAWKGPITVHDILLLLRSQLHVLECQIYGYLTQNNDFAVVIVSTEENQSLLQNEACVREAERISNLINIRSPILTSHLLLSSLVDASLHPASPGGAMNAVYSPWIFFISIISLILQCSSIT